MQSSCPCSSPLLTCTSTGDTQTQFCLRLCGVSGSWCTQGLSQPSERLWQVWGLILNAISPLLPSCWVFSFALGCGVSPQSHSNTSHHFSTYHLAGASLPLDVGYLLTVAPALHSYCSSTYHLAGAFSKWPCLKLASIHFGGARQK